jgi:hypothetical protein
MSAIFVVLFNLVFFVAVSEFTATRWVSWLFIHLAYALLLIASRTIWKSGEGLVFGYPKLVVAAGCFLAEFLLGMVFIIANPSNITFPLFVQLILVAGFGYIYMALLMSEGHTTELQQKAAREIHFIRDFSLRLQAAMKAADDPALRKEIERVYDAVRNAQVGSIPSVADTEEELLRLADAISDAVTNNTPGDIPNLAKKTQALIVKRDNAIRLAR